MRVPVWNGVLCLRQIAGADGDVIEVHVMLPFAFATRFREFTFSRELAMLRIYYSEITNDDPRQPGSISAHR